MRTSLPNPVKQVKVPFKFISLHMNSAALDIGKLWNFGNAANISYNSPAEGAQSIFNGLYQNFFAYSY